MAGYVLTRNVMVRDLHSHHSKNHLWTCWKTWWALQPVYFPCDILGTWKRFMGRSSPYANEVFLQGCASCRAYWGGTTRKLANNWKQHISRRKQGWLGGRDVHVAHQSIHGLARYNCVKGMAEKDMRKKLSHCPKQHANPVSTRHAARQVPVWLLCFLAVTSAHSITNLYESLATLLSSLSPWSAGGGAPEPGDGAPTGSEGRWWAASTSGSPPRLWALVKWRRLVTMLPRTMSISTRRRTISWRTVWEKVFGTNPR